MKNKTHFILLFIVSIGLLAACSVKNNNYQLTKNYKPDDVALYNTIIALDSAFFHTYNTCEINLKKYAEFYDENIEFYHDNGGFINSKKDLVEGTKNNICGKVTRELVKGSIEVYPTKDFGAIEIGLHKFHNKREPKSDPKVGRFTIIWKKTNSDWKIVKVISLH
ncbi:nuclear transport factor 2 family protein [Flavobacterium terrigena]|uniref:DUF4440 domain-containing protein n=1 Tax=Flavobacterium terrigena TaxID=402734 RepID=A0A1H6QQR4_9FLAO|nr:nuclear transport factor 2 family protein [Flavobacterium terrigena]SEI45939.1 protein of unknown function [Flavobacterium terrigena]